jgi:glycine cleavage system aminomethyltransferase T
LRETELDGIPLVVSRTGWSGELGYELYLWDGQCGDALSELVVTSPSGDRGAVVCEAPWFKPQIKIPDEMKS